MSEVLNVVKSCASRDFFTRKYSFKAFYKNKILDFFLLIFLLRKYFSAIRKNEIISFLKFTVVLPLTSLSYTIVFHNVPVYRVPRCLASRFLNIEKDEESARNHPVTSSYR